MCQPGRPLPHGESHDGSPGFADFHSAKSAGSRLRESTSTRAPSRSSSRVMPLSWPYSGNESTLKYTPSSIAYALPTATRRSTIAMISAMWVDTFGSTVGGSTPKRAMSRL